MSTALSAQETERILKEIYDLSQAFLADEVTAIDDIAGFIEQRESLLAGVQDLPVQGFSNTSKAAIEVWITKIQAVDTQLAKRFDQILNETGFALRQMMVSRKVFSGYTFPTINESSGIENEG